MWAKLTCVCAVVALTINQCHGTNPTDVLLDETDIHRVKRSDPYDSIYGPDEHHLVAEEADDYVVNEAMQLEQLYGKHDVHDINNPVTSYTIKTITNAQGQSVILPLVVKAVITEDTIKHVRPPPNVVIPSDVQTNINLMKSSTPSTAGKKFDAGHLIGFQNGGPSLVWNFAPQISALNRGPWLFTENYINKWAKFQGSVDMTVVAFYKGNETVPESFGLKLIFYSSDSTVHADIRDTIYLNHLPN